MSATPIRRRTRLAPSVAGVLLAVALLAGCAGQKAPGSYTSGVRKNFIEGCWTTLVRDGQGAEAKGLTTAQLKAKFSAEAGTATTSCTCAYGRLKDDLKFGDFKKINDDQTEKPSKLDAKVTDIYEKCKVGVPAES